MELGAGIGRFTGELAKKAGQLIALDFIESVIKKVTAVAKDDWLKKKMRFFFFFLLRGLSEYSFSNLVLAE